MNKTGLSLLVISSFVFIFCAESLFARPQYAAKQKMNCQMCHASPFGAGPRTVFGKIYGSRGLLGPKTASTDLFYGDMYMIGNFPTKDTLDKSSGVALMSAMAAVNVPVVETESGSNLRGVLGYDFSPNMNTIRDGYFQWQTGTSAKLVPTHVQVGRFNSPFGLFTDEHRTYTKILTRTAVRDYELGISASGDLDNPLHYDLAVLSGFQSGGTFQTGLKYGLVSNLRWNPASLPFLLGVSLSRHQQKSGDQFVAHAGAAYGIFSLGNITENKVPLSVSGEAVIADGWNQPSLNAYMPSFFIPAALTDTYGKAVADKKAWGVYGQLDYDLFNAFTLFYKFDRLVLATGYEGDAFMRHGFGFSYWIIGNIILHARYEKTFVGQAGIKGSAVKADQDTVLALLRIWL